MKNLNESILNKVSINLEQLIQIFNNSHDGFMVTDDSGNIIFATPSDAMYMGFPLEELIGKNVTDLLKEGVYDKSVILDAIHSKSKKTGIVNLNNGNRVVSTTTPIINEENKLLMTVTNVRIVSLLDQYVEELRKEKRESNRYRSAIKYINNLNMKSNKIIASSPQMKKIIQYLLKVSNTNSTVLLLGESGTGKEVLSRFIHHHSNRENEPFIPVNCAAIPKDLMESEFFGYNKGAFSGALTKGKPGFFELANHGTLFLDEIGDMHLNIQTKFLRVIETGEFQRLGGTSVLNTDVRIIAATNKDLEKKVADGTFREDLYYRINVIPVKIPPLRERKEDIIELAEYLIERLNKRHGTKMKLTPNIRNKFLKYHWPGNIREMKNIIERLSIVANDDEILNETLNMITMNEKQPDIISDGNLENLTKAYNGDLKTLTKAVEKEYIERLLYEYNWKISDVAKILNLHRSMVYRKMEEYKIEKK